MITGHTVTGYLENEKRCLVVPRQVRLLKSKNGGKFVQQLICQSDEEKGNIQRKKRKTVSPACQELPLPIPWPCLFLRFVRTLLCNSREDYKGFIVVMQDLTPTTPLVHFWYSF